jgi:hypothetical protein
MRFNFFFVQFGLPQKFKENWDSSLRPNINFADNNSGKGSTNPDFETLVTN